MLIFLFALESSGVSGGGGVGGGVSVSRLVYSMEFLARMAMSPLCVAPPTEWQRISGEHPSIARKVSQEKLIPINNNNNNDIHAKNQHATIA